MTSRRAVFALAVWDEPFIDKFVSYSLRSQLSGSNLPELSKAYQIDYHFFTTRDSLPYLVKKTRALEAYATLHYHAFSDTSVDGVSLDSMFGGRTAESTKHEINRLTAFWLIDHCLDHCPEAVAFVLDSDQLFTDGSLAAIGRKFDEGVKVVALPVLRLSLERSGLLVRPFLGTPEELEAGFTADDFARRLSYGLHHVTSRCVSTSERFTSYPTSILWPLGGHGFLCRAVFPHPLAFRPSPRCRRFYSTIDYYFCLQSWPEPGAVYIPSREDRILSCKLSSDSAKPQAQTARAMTMSGVAKFLLTATNKLHRTLIEQPSHICVGDADPALLRAVEGDSQQFVANCYHLVERMLEGLDASNSTAALILKSHGGPITDYHSPGRLSAEHLRAFHSIS